MDSSQLAARPKLRLGILLDGCEVPAWTHRALQRVAGSPSADLAFVAVHHGQTRPSALRSLWQDRRHLLYRAFAALDGRLFGREPDALRPMDVRHLLPGVPVLRLAPMPSGPEDSVSAADVAWIREQGLDIVIALTAQAPRGEILQAARYGVWWHDQSERGLHPSGPVGLWEVVEGRPETVANLRMLGGNGHGSRVLCHSSFFTYPFSPARNRSYCLWAASSFLPREIERLQRLGPDEFFRRAPALSDALRPRNHALGDPPSNGATLRLAARLCARNLAEVGRRALYLDQWSLLFDLSGDRQTPFHKFRALVPPKDRFWADPHVIRVDDTYHVFVEEYLYKAGKGRISVMRIDGRGAVGGVVPVLEDDYHLSYPFVFAWQGRYYMIPESAQNRTVDVYECVAFPFEWQFKMHLMQNVHAVDSTLFHHQGRWWLFTGMTENEAAHPQVELFLFSSSELFTDEWQPHPLNPIVSDVKTARPAGKVFSEGGRIFRPSQDCSRTYGYGFDLNEVVLLSETGYSERTVTSVRPDWDERVEATHTFARDGSLTVIDARMRVRKLF